MRLELLPGMAGVQGKEHHTVGAAGVVGLVVVHPHEKDIHHHVVPVQAVHQLQALVVWLGDARHSGRLGSFLRAAGVVGHRADEGVVPLALLVHHHVDAPQHGVGIHAANARHQKHHAQAQHQHVPHGGLFRGPPPGFQVAFVFLFQGFSHKVSAPSSLSGEAALCRSSCSSRVRL